MFDIEQRAPFDRRWCAGCQAGGHRGRSGRSSARRVGPTQPLLFFPSSREGFIKMTRNG